MSDSVYINVLCVCTTTLLRDSVHVYLAHNRLLILFTGDVTNTFWNALVYGSSLRLCGSVIVCVYSDTPSQTV